MADRQCSGYIAGETRRFARVIGFEPLTTPVGSPRSNGMAEAFVLTIKRDYARVKPMQPKSSCAAAGMVRSL
jgi:putative transposase